MDLSRARVYVAQLNDGRACFGVIREFGFWQDSFKNEYSESVWGVWLREGWHVVSLTSSSRSGAQTLRVVNTPEGSTPRIRRLEPIPWLEIGPSAQQQSLWRQFELRLGVELLERLRALTLHQPFGGLGQLIIEGGCNHRVVGMIVSERQCVFQVEPWERADLLANDAVIALVADMADFPNNRYQVYTFGQVKPVRTAVIHFG